MSDRDGKPQSLDQPWWLGKAKRQHILVKFVVICVVIALLILGIAIIAVRLQRTLPRPDDPERKPGRGSHRNSGLPELRVQVLQVG